MLCEECVVWGCEECVMCVVCGGVCEECVVWGVCCVRSV